MTGTPSLCIDQLRKKYIPALATLAEREPNPPTTQDFRDFLSKRFFTAVALSDAYPVGFAAIEQCKKRCELLGIFVASEQRRLGIGTRLVEHLLPQAKATGKSLVVGVIPDSIGEEFFLTLQFKFVSISYSENREPGAHHRLMYYLTPIITDGMPRRKKTAEPFPHHRRYQL